MATVEIVTCSYAPDLELCKILCESVRTCVPSSIGHTLVIPKRDLRLFQPLRDQRTTIIVAEEVLPWFFWRVPLTQKLWLTFAPAPVRGWVIQQILKLSTPTFVDKDVIVHVDSDTCFLRPFSENCIVHDGAVRLYYDPTAPEMMPHMRWHKEAARLLGLPPTSFFGADYIAQLVSWRRQTVLDLQQHIEKRFGAPWQLVLARIWHFSEYILYGVYVQHYMKDHVHHYYDARDLCHSSWLYQFDKNGSIFDFIRGIKPYQVMAHIQSFENIGVARRMEIFRTISEELAKHNGQCMVGGL